MSVTLALLTAFGKPVADKLLKGLSETKNGPQKLEQASAAMTQGLTAIDALKKVFGKDFLSSLNDAIGTARNPSFEYDAGTQSYIQLKKAGYPPVRVLRDELNINLDRLTVLNGNSTSLRNHFKGLMLIWQSRVRKVYGAKNGDDIEETFQAINDLLDGTTRNYRQIYQMVSKTGIGGIGALLLISGVFIATGTGVGVVSAITAFIFGIPWITVGALVLPGALMVTLAAKKSRPADHLSLATGLAYKLLERLDLNR